MATFGLSAPKPICGGSTALAGKEFGGDVGLSG